MAKKAKLLGEILVTSGIIKQEKLTELLKLQKIKNKKLGELVIDEGILNERQMVEVLEFQLGVPHMDLNKYQINPIAPKKINEKIAREYQLIPINFTGNKLLIAMVDPLNLVAIDDVKRLTKCDVEYVISTKTDVMNAIDKFYDRAEETNQAVSEFEVIDETEENKVDHEKIQEDINNAPAVKVVNSLISQAIKSKTSDIHIEPFEKSLKVRFRKDGELVEVMKAPVNTASAIVTRIKIIGKLDIAEKRIPQDGRVELSLEGKRIDMRISVLPTVFGEKVVIRLLDSQNISVTKQQLGFTEENLQKFDKMFSRPEGIVLVTGPTGSGKTTTLYTALKEVNKPTVNIVTVEDPVEYRLDGVNQVQVNVKAGMTFAAGLRSILRQDPDIVMVGEIRDGETAQIAVRAAITGHLVLSTLHTNDTASSIARLMDMGVDNFMVSSALIGVIAQRLVKKICTKCKTEYEATDDEKIAMGIDVGETVKLFKGKGCQACNKSGYAGRTAIHEVLYIDKELRQAITKGTDSDSLKDLAIKKGMTTLYQTCKQIVLEGKTTVDEMLRVTYNVDS